MSRIGKKPVAVLDKVTVAIADRKIDVKGPKGSLTFTHHEGVKVEQSGSEIIVTPVDDSNKNRALWGLTRTLVDNMVVGVHLDSRKLLNLKVLVIKLL